MLPSRSMSVLTAAGTLALIAGRGLSQPPAAVAPMPEVLRNYQTVTADRLKNPEDGSWLMIRRTYDGWATAPSDRSRPTTSSGCARFGCLRPVSLGFTRLRPL